MLWALEAEDIAAFERQTGQQKNGLWIVDQSGWFWGQWSCGILRQNLHKRSHELQWWYVNNNHKSERLISTSPRPCPKVVTQSGGTYRERKDKWLTSWEFINNKSLFQSPEMWMGRLSHLQWLRTDL